MKLKFMLVAVLVSFSASTQKQSDLTQQRQDEIKKELKVVIDSMIAAIDRLDAAAGIQFYWDSPDFMAINADGSISDYHALKKMGVEGAKTIASMTISTSQVDFVVLTQDVAICTWRSKGEVALKSGTKMKYDPDVLTLIFRRIDGKWKITYSQESATIVTQKASKE